MLLCPLRLPSWPGPPGSAVITADQYHSARLLPSLQAGLPSGPRSALFVPSPCLGALSPGPPISDPELARSPLKLLHPPWASLVFFTGQGSTAATVREGCGLGSSVPVVIPEKLVLTSVCHETEAGPCEQCLLFQFQNVSEKPLPESREPSCS